MATSSRATASRHNTRSCEQCTRITRRRLATRFAPRTGVHNAAAGTSCCWKQVQTFTSTPRFHCRVGVRDGILQFYTFFIAKTRSRSGTVDRRYRALVLWGSSCPGMLAHRRDRSRNCFFFRLHQIVLATVIRLQRRSRRSRGRNPPPRSTHSVVARPAV